MNLHSGVAVNSKEKRKAFSLTALSLTMVLALVFSSSLSVAGEPIDGIDVKLGKNPGGSVSIIARDKNGGFSLQIKEPGQYTVSTACQQGGCPPTKLSINISGVEQKPSAGEPTTYAFTVDKGQSVVLNGQIIRITNIRVNAPPGMAVAAPHSTGGNKEPSRMGDPIPGISVGLDHEPSDSQIISVKTDKNGAFEFTKLPAGKYKVIVPGQSPQSITVGTEGAVSGKMVKNIDGKITLSIRLGPMVSSIYDRWGNLRVGIDPKGGGAKPTPVDQAVGKDAAEKNPVGFGSGNDQGLGINPGMGSGGVMPPSNAGGPMPSGPVSGGPASGPRH